MSEIGRGQIDSALPHSGSDEQVRDYFLLLCKNTNLWHNIWRERIWPDGDQKRWLENNVRQKGSGKLVPLNLGRLIHYIGQPDGKLLGVRPGLETDWLAVDVDIHSPYHPANNPEQFDRLVQLLRDHDLSFVLVRSSDSHGVHLWIPLPLCSSAALAEFADDLFRSAGFIIRKGTLELFPNVRKEAGSRYLGIRLPLMHPDSRVLDQENYTPIAESLSTFRQKLPLFLQHWRDALERNAGATESLPIHAGGGGYYSPALIAENEKRLAEGFTGRSQSSKLAGNACFIGASKGLTGAALQAYMNKRLSELPGFERYSRHQREILKGDYSEWVSFYSARANRLDARFRRGGRRPAAAAPATPAPANRGNLATREANRAAITEAVADLCRRMRFCPTREAAREAVAAKARELGHEQITARTCRHHQDLLEPLIRRGWPRG
jgi:hypothetical protein